MRLNRNLLIGMLAACVLIACDDEGNNGGSSDNSFTFNGETYVAVDGFIEDNGDVDPLEDGNPVSHYNYVVGISDADFQLIEEDGGDTYFGGDDGVSIVIYFDLYSDGITSFQTGTFDFIDLDNAAVTDISGESFFANGEIELDDDGLAPNGDLDGAEYEIIGGTIELTGSANNYTIDFTIEVADEAENPVGAAVGSYSGTFQYLDSTN